MRAISMILACVLLMAGHLWVADSYGGSVSPETHKPGVVMTKMVQASITPEKAMDILKEGNARFVAGKPLQRDVLYAVKETASGQYPLASVVSCIDSRVPVEMLFDQSVGDIFVARLAGNVVDNNVLGSLEYASKVAGARIIVVLGHTGCGAVKGVCDGVRMGHLTSLLAHIQPVVAEVKTKGERNSQNHQFVDAVTKANIKKGMQVIRNNSPILDEMARNGQIHIVGALYDISTGVVAWTFE